MISNPQPNAESRRVAPKLDAGGAPKSDNPPVIRVWPGGQKLQLTPGIFAQPAPLAVIPAYGLVEWVRCPDGKFEMRLLKQDAWVQVTDATESVDGIPLSRSTLLRLGRAGFIRLRRITPLSIQVHLGSLLDHLEAVEDPEFWDERNNRKYREALGND